jgi:hypothetical protein
MIDTLAIRMVEALERIADSLQTIEFQLGDDGAVGDSLQLLCHILDESTMEDIRGLRALRIKDIRN